MGSLLLNSDARILFDEMFLRGNGIFHVGVLVVSFLCYEPLGCTPNLLFFSLESPVSYQIAFF